MHLLFQDPFPVEILFLNTLKSLVLLTVFFFFFPNDYGFFLEGHISLATSFTHEMLSLILSFFSLLSPLKKKKNPLFMWPNSIKPSFKDLRHLAVILNLLYYKCSFSWGWKNSIEEQIN